MKDSHDIHPPILSATEGGSPKRHGANYPSNVGSNRLTSVTGHRLDTRAYSATVFPLQLVKLHTDTTPPKTVYTPPKKQPK